MRSSLLLPLLVIPAACGGAPAPAAPASPATPPRPPSPTAVTVGPFTATAPAGFAVRPAGDDAVFFTTPTTIIAVSRSKHARADLIDAASCTTAVANVMIGMLIALGYDGKIAYAPASMNGDAPGCISTGRFGKNGFVAGGLAADGGDGDPIAQLACVATGDLDAAAAACNAVWHSIECTTCRD